MRQILYLSLSAIPEDKADLVGILKQSRHNNAIDGITGLLWSDGRSFLQAIEGPKESVANTFARIIIATGRVAGPDARTHMPTIVAAPPRPSFGHAQ